MKHRMLVDTFGSKKAKRQKRAREANQVTAEQVSGRKALTDILHAKSAAAAESKKASGDKADAALREHRLKLLPPHDEHAASVERVYDMQQFLPKKLAIALRPARQKLEKLAKSAAALEKAHAAKAIPAYVRARLKLLGEEQDAGQRSRALGWLAYLVCLLRVHKLGRFFSDEEGGQLRDGGGGGIGTDMHGHAPASCRPAFPGTS